MLLGWKSERGKKNKKKGFALCVQIIHTNRHTGTDLVYVSFRRPASPIRKKYHLTLCFSRCRAVIALGAKGPFDFGRLVAHSSVGIDAAAGNEIVAMQFRAPAPGRQGKRTAWCTRQRSTVSG